MRILLATEGDSDQVIALRLLERHLGQVSVHPKSLLGRGVDVILRVASDCVRAAYFGHFDMLVVHFDMDDTLPRGSVRAGQSERWVEISSRITRTLSSLPEAHRRSPLKIVFMTPREAMDAWLSWGVEDGSGHGWELKNRHELKRKLYGDPPRGMTEKASGFVNDLIAQMQENKDWPVTLRWFVNELTA